MDLFTSIRVFHQVVKSGSFTQAAQELNMSTAMASKHLTHLEARLQARLLTRTSRRLSLTEAGENYLQESNIALEILDSAARTASAGAIQPKGTLKITLPAWLANDKLALWITQYRQQYPDVILSMNINNHFVDLIEEGYDLALRATAKPSPSLIVKPLVSMPFFAVATPEYLQQHPPIATPQDLIHHATLLPSYADMENLDFRRADEISHIHLQAAINANDTRFLHSLARQHNGIAFLPASLVEDDLRHKLLVQVLPEWHIPTVTIYAAYINREYLSAKVRSFIDFLSHKIQAEPPSQSHQSSVG